MNAIPSTLQDAPRFPALRRSRLETLQVNLGYRCNQACSHCHVDAGPARTESMSRETAEQVLAFMREAGVGTLDLTGGAPELNAHFRHIVASARAANVAVIDRCNLTVIEEPGQEELVDFLAANAVRVVASLPCYSAANVDAQRGKGVYARSLRGIAKLNAAGYGMPDSPLVLDFVYNPGGASLPPDPAVLEADYKAELGRRGIRFNRLLTITNMPIRRFRHELVREGRLDDYMALLVDAFEPTNLAQVMCRSLLSVDWRGYVYDCDFNQMLGIPMGGGAPRHVGELAAEALAGTPIATAAHCYGCTAGRGSSCGGALSD